MNATGGSRGSTMQEAAFAERAERHRRELHLHAYRMLASFDEAEDAVQEAMLRAWRARDSFDGGNLRAWLYRIATNVCLDVIRRRRPRKLAGLESMADLPWLQPYPDVLLDQVAPRADQPEAMAVERETIELTFLAAMQVLPPRQRAALIVRDVLGWPALDTATLLETTVPAANSALQRARATMQAHLPARRSEWNLKAPSDLERELLSKFIDAHERGDAKLAVSIASQDLKIAMPPAPVRFQGLDTVAPLLERALSEGEWRLVATMANRMPTAASYLRRTGDPEFRAFKFDVLRITHGKIAEITTFGPHLFPAFGLPTILLDPTPGSSRARAGQR